MQYTTYIITILCWITKYFTLGMKFMYSSSNQARCNTQGTHKSRQRGQSRCPEKGNILRLRDRVSWSPGTSLQTEGDWHYLCWSPRAGWWGQFGQQKIRHRRFSRYSNHTTQKWQTKSKEKQASVLNEWLCVFVW